MEKVYKVISFDHKRRVSAIVGIPRIRVRYFLNKWIKPKLRNSKLFAFNNYDDAFEFCSQISASEIWECEARGVFLATQRAVTSRDEIIIFWQGDRGDIFILDVPSGTVWCDEIKLIRRVYPGRFY